MMRPPVWQVHMTERTRKRLTKLYKARCERAKLLGRPLLSPPLLCPPLPCPPLRCPLLLYHPTGRYRRLYLPDPDPTTLNPPTQGLVHGTLKRDGLVMSSDDAANALLRLRVRRLVDVSRRFESEANLTKAVRLACGISVNIQKTYIHHQWHQPSVDREQAVGTSGRQRRL